MPPAQRQINAFADEARISAGGGSEFHPTGQARQNEPQKARLRKACDGCSLRKVKVCCVTPTLELFREHELISHQCDENTPCKPCRDLGLDCRFDRPSRRRGPPNRHAETLKRQKLDHGMPGGGSGSNSPVHNAQILASIAQAPFHKPTLETIAPLPVVYALIEDYFTQIHPQIPIPHEPSFREALTKRDDHREPIFLALMASMAGCVVACFPGRLYQHYRMQNTAALPGPVEFVQKCHAIAVEARGPNFLDRTLSVVDAAVSLLLGMTGLFAHNIHKARVYLEQCLTMSKLLGLHRAFGTGYINIDGSRSAPSSANGVEHPDPHRQQDYVLEELAKRIFWLAFMALKTLQQLGHPAEDLNILPAEKERPYPALPVEVDDVSIDQKRIWDQPKEMVPEILAFNANVQFYLAYNKLSFLGPTAYVEEVSVCDIQKGLTKQSIQQSGELLN